MRLLNYRAALLTLAGLGGGVPALAQPVNYTLQSLITVPATAANVQPGGAFTSFDIGYFDPVSKEGLHNAVKAQLDGA